MHRWPGAGLELAQTRAARLWIGSGVRAVEADLLAVLEADLGDLVRAPHELGRPVRVVVPSASLREHLACALVAHCGRALAGLRIQTLAGLAREVLERSGELAQPVDGLFGALVARAARAEPRLAEAFGALRSGFGWVAASAADLLDAGLEPEHAEALDELLAEGGAGPEWERARAAVRVACAAASRMAELGAVREGDLLARAGERLQQSGADALPTRALRVHGFADATGRAADLLQVLLRSFPSAVWLDVPRDPWSALEPAPLLDAYTGRLRERLQAVAVPGPLAPAPAPAPAPALLRLRTAPRPEDEARALARDLRELLDAGAVPESIGVVVRELAPWVVPLRTQLGRLGVPFSGAAAHGPATAHGRQLAGLLELLRDPQAVSAVRWLELLRELPGLGPLGRSARAELALAGHMLGASRLGQLAAAELGSGEGPGLALPLRRGPEAAQDASSGAQSAQRRHMPWPRLQQLQKCAREWLQRQQRWSSTARPARAHARQIAAAARSALAWPARDEAARALRNALDELAARLPSSLELDAQEFRALLARALQDALASPLGGAGAGVQVLGVMEARARSFEHLFVLGLTRDAFPRRLSDDPLLPDPVRARIAQLLPDLPIRVRSRDEERHLFAQLLSASPRVCLSRAERDARGALELPSSFLERFELAGVQPALERAPSLGSLDPALGPRTAYEHARLAGVYGGAPALAERLALALCEPHAGGESKAAEPAARARIAVLAELERGGEELGPYGGWVGPLRSPRDPRAGPLYVTALEALARCPWQAFLRRVLRAEPPRDAAAALPGLDPRRVGEALHRALEQIARELGAARGVALAALAPGSGPPLRWPGAAALQRILAHSAQGVLREHGPCAAALAPPLAHSLEPRLRAAPAVLAALAAGEPLRVLGVEVEGVLPAGAGGLAEPLHFRADWVIERAGRRVLVDFKTGRAFAASARSRAAQQVAAVASGQYLQAVVYGRAAGEGERGAYAYLDPELAPELAWCEMPHAEPALHAALESVLPVLEGAYRAGLFPARLLRASGDAEPAACRFCEVSEACSQGELAARRRYAAALQALERGPGSGCAPLDALLELPEPPA